MVGWVCSFTNYQVVLGLRPVAVTFRLLELYALLWPVCDQLWSLPYDHDHLFRLAS